MRSNRLLVAEFGEGRSVIREELERGCQFGLQVSLDNEGDSPVWFEVVAHHDGDGPDPAVVVTGMLDRPAIERLHGFLGLLLARPMGEQK